MNDDGLSRGQRRSDQRRASMATSLREQSDAAVEKWMARIASGTSVEYAILNAHMEGIDVGLGALRTMAGGEA